VLVGGGGGGGRGEEWDCGGGGGVFFFFFVAVWIWKNGQSRKKEIDSLKKALIELSSSKSILLGNSTWQLGRKEDMVLMTIRYLNYPIEYVASGPSRQKNLSAVFPLTMWCV